MDTLTTLKAYYQRIPHYLRNKYALTLFGFLLWMLFFDTNTVSSQFKLQQQLKSMEEKKTYYEEEIIKVDEALEELMTNEASLEKFARENYLMKRTEEDVFVIVEE